MSQFEKEVFIFYLKIKIINKLVVELKESLCFCEDDILDLKNVYYIKENCFSNIKEKRKQIRYLEI